MLVRFTKTSVAAKADRLTCVRADGTTTIGEMPRQGILPHDAIHFVVESTLGWRDAFYGHVARGVELTASARESSGMNPDWADLPQALQAESLVECLQAEQWGGPAAPETFQQTLEVACRQRRVDAPVLSVDDLRRVRTALREFGAAWRPLPPGGSVERTF